MVWLYHLIKAVDIEELLVRSFFQGVQQRVYGACFSSRMHDVVNDVAVSWAQKKGVMLTFAAKTYPERFAMYRLLMNVQCVAKVVQCVNLKSLYGGRESLTALRRLLIHRCPSLVSVPASITPLL